jgi:hypothetical protein
MGVEQLRHVAVVLAAVDIEQTPVAKLPIGHQCAGRQDCERLSFHARHSSFADRVPVFAIGSTGVTGTLLRRSRAKSVRTCQCLRPRRAVWALALSRPSVLPSVTGTTSAPRMRGTFAAQWLAYALPCQRFANTLTGIGA